MCYDIANGYVKNVALNVMYSYVKDVGHFAQKHVGTYFNFRWKLGSAVDDQVGESILHVLIVYVEETFLFSLGIKELIGKDADL